MNRYGSYKDSEVEWIGKIPSHWSIIRLKYKGDVIIGLSYKPDDVVMEDEGVLVMRSSNVQNGKPSFHDNVYVKSDIPKKLKTKEGDILICSRNGSRRLIGKNCLITKDIEGMTWGVFMTMYRSPYYRFIYWLLNSPIFESQSGLFLTSTINQLTVSTLQNMILPFTDDVNEQQQIVSFLNNKTSLIDSLIEKTQKKIELLKEQRISLINEVVTKGLNPNVELKESGVEWIGEIPSHWEFVRVGHFNRVVRGGSPRPSGDPRFFNGSFIHWITVKDITSKIGKYVCGTISMLTEEGMKQSRVLEPETLVLTNSGVTLGVPGILKIKGCINDGSVGFLDMSSRLVRDFLYYFWVTQTELLLEQQSGYGQPNLNIEIVSNIKFPLPPISEQKQIVEYLDKKTNLIDSTIYIEEKRIENLKEYRQSLISEVVTGKIKVTT